MGIHSNIGLSVGLSIGLSVGLSVGLSMGRGGKIVSSLPPSHIWVQNGHESILAPTLNTKIDPTDFASYFEHKIDPNSFALAKRFFWGGNKLCCFFTPQRGSIESFGFRFFCCWGAKLQRNRGMHQIPIRKRTFFTCSVHKFFKNS